MAAWLFRDALLAARRRRDREHATLLRASEPVAEVLNVGMERELLSRRWPLSSRCSGRRRTAVPVAVGVTVTRREAGCYVPRFC